MIQDREGKEVFSVRESLYQFLNKVKDKINKTDSEYWILVSGDTGSGKSVRSMQLGYIIDKSLSLDRICFDKTEFVRAVLNAKRGQVIIADEAISIFFGRSAMQRENRAVIELTNQIRQKNLCVIVCVPHSLDLDSAIRRKVNAVVEVWEAPVDRSGIMHKGHMKLYIRTRQNPNKLIFYFSALRDQYSAKPRKMKKPAPILNQKGGSVNSKPWLPVDEKEYRKKKESILKKYLDKKETTASTRAQKWEQQRDMAFYKVQELLGTGTHKTAEFLGVPQKTVYESIKRHKKTFEGEEGGV